MSTNCDLTQKNEKNMKKEKKCQSLKIYKNSVLHGTFIQGTS